MTDEDTDKTEEIRDELEDDGALGGDTDSSDGAILTLDGTDDAGAVSKEDGGEDA